MKNVDIDEVLKTDEWKKDKVQVLKTKDAREEDLYAFGEGKKKKKGQVRILIYIINRTNLNNNRANNSRNHNRIRTQFFNIIFRPSNSLRLLKLLLHSMSVIWRRLFKASKNVRSTMKVILKTKKKKVKIIK